MSELEKELQQIEAQCGEEFGDASESEEDELNSEEGGGEWEVCLWGSSLASTPVFMGFGGTHTQQVHEHRNTLIWCERSDTAFEMPGQRYQPFPLI